MTGAHFSNPQSQIFLKLVARSFFINSVQNLAQTNLRPLKFSCANYSFTNGVHKLLAKLTPSLNIKVFLFSISLSIFLFDLWICLLLSLFHLYFLHYFCLSIFLFVCLFLIFSFLSFSFCSPDVSLYFSFSFYCLYLYIL